MLLLDVHVNRHAEEPASVSDAVYTLGVLHSPGTTHGRGQSDAGDARQ